MERITISNQVMRGTRSKDMVRVAGGSFAPSKVPGSCGWEGAKRCYALVSIEYGGNCSWASAQAAGCDAPYGTCGRSEGRILLYLSAELAQGPWSDAVELLPASARPKGSYSRPHLAYNAASSTYVLWVRWTPPEGGSGRLLVAVSKTLDSSGFAVVLERAVLSGGADAGSSAASIFVDDDGAAYAVRARSDGSGGGATVVVERLTPEWTSALDAAAPAVTVGDAGAASEYAAPAMFKTGGAYFVVFAPGACCFCAGGGREGLAFVAATPAGPFEAAGRLGEHLGAQGDGVLVHEDLEGVLWTGTRWGVAGPLDETPVFWALVNFYTPPRPALPRALQMEWHDTFTMRVRSG